MNQHKENSILWQSLSALKSVDAKRLPLYKRLVGGELIIDLLMHLPSNVIYRKETNGPSTAYHDHLISVVFLVERHQRAARRGQPYKIIGTCAPDHTRFLELIFFNGSERFLSRIAPVGRTVGVSGKMQCKNYRSEDIFQITHPDFIGPVAELAQWVGPQAIYPLTHGLTQSMVCNTLTDALKDITDVPEWLSAHILEKYKFPTWCDALKSVHSPTKIFDISPLSINRQRLAFDELFAKQLSQRYYHLKAQKTRFAPVLGQSSILLDRFFSSLPFQLTHDQHQAIQQIAYDMAQPVPMHRLLQGDVGSGKTLVALAAALVAIENGKQAAILAPTDILVRQHFANVQKFFKDLDIQSVVLTGREKGKVRQAILQDIASGKTQLILGTHAIFQPDVIYHGLGLAVIDEQHRFGVKQRLHLASKADRTHVLSMTATPIPRTLLLANYGEMTVSQIKEKPPGRKPVETRTINLEDLNKVIEFVAARIQKGEKIFWVCPLVEESETSDLAAATIRFEMLKEQFGDCVVLTHGQQKSIDKEESLNRFANGDALIMVATTVIEVGVDVPKATVMIIEHAERFGLAQLHQLRGRIGRGDLNGLCLLLFDKKLSYIAKQRLLMMKKTDDGFVLAEEDLRLRGGGDTLGLRQSGLPKFKFAVFGSEDYATESRYQALYEEADQAARTLLEQDPDLVSAQGHAAQFVMRVFQCDEGEKLKKAG